MIETDYQIAREKFAETADEHGLRTLRMRVAAENQPDLFIDFALQKRDPERLLVQLSGVHGIEGYAGSAIQRLVMQQIPEGGPSLLFVHAVNPYGMANYRRANAQNVDLNRSYNKQPVKNDDYAYFDSYLNPQNRLGFYTGFLKAAMTRARLGEARTRQAVAAGQMGWPHGIFYTGKEIQREVMHVQEILRAHFAQVHELTCLDLHTGLGPWKGEMLFVDHDRESDSPAYFSQLFGRAMDVPDPTKGAYSINGRLSDCIRDALPHTKLRYCLQEFGTLKANQVIGALRRENFEWRTRPAGTLPSPAIQKEMLAAFLPASEGWQSYILALGVQRWKQALSGLRPN